MNNREQYTKQSATALSLSPVSRYVDLPLSFAQQRLWFLDQLDPASTVYNMSTAVRHGVAIVIIVVNNDGNCGAPMQKSFFPAGSERIMMYEPGIRHENIMRAFGDHAEFVERPEEMQPALGRAVASGKAACVNVRVDPYAPHPKD